VSNREKSGRRVVVIVGRPNVGKSAIFNRLARKRVAIVHQQSGVTRDRMIREVNWGEERFELIDTGGLCNVDGAIERDAIAAAIRSQVGVGIADAAVAMLVVDIESGMAPLDQEVAGILRRGGCCAVVAANKSDNAARDSGTMEFEQFGFSVFPVSALHNRGFGRLMEAVLDMLPDAENVTEIRPLRVAVVGHPNVGKSSYINRLLRDDRVIVSEVPGTTRDSIDVPFSVGKGEQARHYVLIDTAGMRRGGKVRNPVERFSMLRTQKSVRNADVVVLVLDAAQGPTAQDKKIGSAVLENGKGCVLLVNKWDLADVTQRRYGPEVVRVMPFMSHCPMVFVSAKTGYNMRRSVEAIDHVASQVQSVLPTGILNRTVLDAAERVQPPRVKGTRLKIFYTAQVGSGPIRIRMFVNDPSRARSAYRDYLVRILRERFGLEGAPVVLQFRARRAGRGVSS